MSTEDKTQKPFTVPPPSPSETWGIKVNKIN